MKNDSFQDKTIDLTPISIENKKNEVEDGLLKSAEKGKDLLLNEWEKLTALSNRRLTHQTLRFFFDLVWSIDRITIVGLLREFSFEHTFVTEDGEILYNAGERFTFNQAMPILAREGAAEQSSNGWNLVDKYGENIAYVQSLSFKDEKTGRQKGRIDFNPSKIQQFLKTDLKDFIALMFDEPHFSRADVACDIVNLPDNYVSQYRVVDAVSFRPYYGPNGALETAYWGARSSERQVRLYNKCLEQTKKGHFVPDEIKSWWRLEVQLRRGKADNWIENVYATLDSFYSLNYFPSEMKATDRVMIAGLIADHQSISYLSDNTKRKYRKLMKQVAKEDELTQYLKSSFSESIDDLKEELNSWLRVIKVDD